MANKVESLEDKLKETAMDVIDYRIEQWAKYYFEKELLPALKYEIKERLLIQTFMSLEKHGGITLDISFTPRKD